MNDLNREEYVPRFHVVSTVADPFQPNKLGLIRPLVPGHDRPLNFASDSTNRVLPTGRCPTRGLGEGAVRVAATRFPRA